MWHNEIYALEKSTKEIELEKMRQDNKKNLNKLIVLDLDIAWVSYCVILSHLFV